ncbi:PAS domain-containing protein [Flaviaesturariibacter flavus]|nr:PAS domain-containing protein [Flaviaesturariibacter flavus]
MTDNPPGATFGAEISYSALFEAMPGSSVLLRNDAPRFTIVAATPAYIAQTGYPGEYLVGKGLFEAFPASSNPSNTGERRVHASLRAVLDTNEPQYLPLQRYDLMDEDGSFSEKYWETSNKPVFGADGEVAFIIHSATDITSQVLAGQLKERIKGIEQAHHIFLQAPVVIGILRGPEHIIELVNEDALKFWNKTDAIIGKPLLVAIPELKGQPVCAEIDRVFQTGALYHAAAVPVASVKDGAPVMRYFDLYYKPYYDEGSSIVNGVFTISNEVTETVLARRKAEESEDRFRVLADQAPMMVFMADTGAAVTFCNRYWLQYTGQSVEEALGRAWKDVVHPDDFESLLNTYLQATASHQSYSAEARMRRRDGVYRCFLFTGGPRYSSDGSLLGNIGTGVDIEDRKQAAEALRKSEQNLRNTILQAPVAMAILRGSNHVIEIANDHMYELWGRGEEELVGKSVFEGLPEVRNQGYEELLNGVFTTGERFTAFGIPVILPRNNTTETVYINLLYEAYREFDGTIAGIIAVATEVTEQIAAQKKLEENEILLQQRVAERTADLEEQKGLIANILEASLDGIYALRAVREGDGSITDFEYLFANSNTAQLLQKNTGEIIGASMLTVLPENRDNGFFDLFCTLLRTGETTQGETHFVAQNINSWYRYAIVPLDKDTLVVSTEDITEKKQAALHIEEQRNLLDSILKNSSNGISVSRVYRDDGGEVIDARTIMANDAAVRFIGLPKEIYLTKTATEIEPHIKTSPYFRQCVQTLETGEAFLTQYLMESTDKWLELTVSKLDQDHLIHVFSDVTPIKQAQLRLERSLEDLKRTNKDLEQFAYAASHDLKEPVRKIHFFSQRLKDSLGDRILDSERKYFERMESASIRMKTLIDDLLSYSQVGQRAPAEDTVDMNELMQQVLTDLDLEIEQRGATIIIPELFTITGHHRQLQQAFQNIFSNALKYSLPGKHPVITLECSRIKGQNTGLQLTEEEKARDFHLLAVTDNGIGFNQADAERIFNVFTRLHGASEYIGTGVGLSIVRRVIENHHGFIWAESQPGQGATFKVLLPTEQVEHKPVAFSALSGR